MKVKSKEFIDDLIKIAREVPNIVEDNDNAAIIVTWLEKLLIKIKEVNDNGNNGKRS